MYLLLLLFDHFLKTPVVHKTKGPFVICLVLGLVHNIESCAFTHDGVQIAVNFTPRKYLTDPGTTY